jgi:hypothetical protein
MAPSARMTLAFLFCFLISGFWLQTPAHALSVKDFEAMPVAEQSAFVTAFVDKMTGDIGPDNPQLAQGIHDYFFRTPPGQRFNEGLWNLQVELAALDIVAQHGKADLSKIQIEGVIFKVVKDKFPPQK